jgi:proton-dependent oligopeptide transporter, POT family
MEQPFVAAVNKKGYPKSLPFILGNEAAERYCYYGMRAILTTFLVAQFFNPANNPLLATKAMAEANEKTHLFIALIYFTPLLGGLLSDWFLGKYRTILWVSIIYCIGSFTIAASTANYNAFMFGLLLIAVGSGGIKPCVSANMGDQFNKTNQHLISKAYGIFYFSINIGSFISTLMIPPINKAFGPRIAFGLPGVFMALATVVFWLGRKRYVKVPPSGYKKENFVAINSYALFRFFKKKNGKSGFAAAKEKFSDSSIDGVKAVWRVLAVFAFIPIWWALYDQSSSEWVLQATNKHMNLDFLGIHWLPQQIQAINPVLILAFIPLFSSLIYPGVEKLGIKVTPLRKIGAGFIMMILAFFCISHAQTRLDHGLETSIIWQILAYTSLTASEILISITGLEYGYTQAPKTMKSTLSAFWLLTVSAGDYFDAYVNSNIAKNGFFSRFTGASYFHLFMIILSVVAILFFIISPFIKEKVYLVEDEELMPHNIIDKEAIIE